MNSFAALIELNEGRKRFPYIDSVGKQTIGVGWNLTDNGLPEDVIADLERRATAIAVATVQAIFGFVPDLTIARHSALVDMAYEMGHTRLSGFMHLRACWEKQDWSGAAEAAHQSLWAKEVPERAARDIGMIRSGEWPA